MEKCHRYLCGRRGSAAAAFPGYGIIPGAAVTMVKYAPMGDPVEVRIHSYELTLRLKTPEKFRSRMNGKRQ